MDTSTLTKRLIIGSSLRVFLLGANIAVSFFMMPFLIHTLGNRWYGFWTFIGTFMGFYGFLDIGLSSAVSRFISRAYGQKDHSEMNVVINTSLVLFSIVGFIAFAITIMMALMAAYFVRNPEEVALFQKVIIVLGLDISLSFPMRAFTGVLMSKIRYDLSTYRELIKLLLRTLLIFVFIGKGYGLLALAIISFGVNLLGHMMSYFLIVREFTDIKFSMVYFVRDRIKHLFRYSQYTFISQLSDVLRFRVDAFVITYFLDLSKVTIFFIASRLIEYFGQLITSAIGLFMPVFSQYEGIGDYNKIKTLFVKTTKIAIVISVFVGMSLIFYGRPFIAKWMGPDFSASYNLLVILTIPAIFNLMQNPSVELLYGISENRLYAQINVCEGIANLVLSLILVQYYGLVGVALGTAIPMIISKLFIQPFFVCRVLKMPIYDYFINVILKSLMKAASPMFLFFFIIRSYSITEYIDIIVFMSMQFVLCISLSFFMVLNSQERESFYQFLRIK